MRLIDADKLDLVVHVPSQNNAVCQQIADEVGRQIVNAPTVDAEPIKHGYWIFEPKDAIEMLFTLPKCSECGAESSDGGNYCSNCGAKMDERKENAKIG